MVKDTVLGKVLIGIVSLSDEALDLVLNIVQMLAGQNRTRWIYEVKRFLRQEPCWVTHIIDLDTAPFVLDSWTVEEHKKGGQWKFDPKQINLYLAEDQMKSMWLEGHKLRKILAGQNVLNANVLDYLLRPENQYLIPEDWKGKNVYFWGTIYCDFLGNLYIRFLSWDSGKCDWGHGWLSVMWGKHDPAAVLAA